LPMISSSRERQAIGRKSIFFSYAKVNLYLDVVRRRKDGYHDIRTIFERVDLRDKITIRLKPGNYVRVSCDYPGVPQDSGNLAYLAAVKLLEYCGVTLGVEISIAKRIPLGAGLGGGSGNAAAVLLGLNRMLNLGLTRKILFDLAAGIGSDTAFFITESPFASGTGRGEIIKPLRKLDNLRFWHVLVYPSIMAPTPVIYRQWDRRFSEHKHVLTNIDNNVKIINSIYIRGVFPGYNGELFNGLEGIAVDLYPEIRRVKEEFARLGIEANAMSGSGSCVFAVVSSRLAALKLARQIRGNNRGWRIFVAETASPGKAQHKEVGHGDHRSKGFS
jgi:4-diphosphocytidyl-2-C-methyl-D-erythritol kinase